MKTLERLLPLPAREGWGEGVLLAAFAMTAVGCTQQATITTAKTSAAAKVPVAEDLSLALKSLRTLAEGNDAQPAQRTIFYLNQWISSDPAAQRTWQPDRLIDSMPRALKSTPGMDRLDRLQFTAEGIVQWLDDISYLQQNLWLHDIASRVRREPPPGHLQPWLKQLESSVGLPEAEQLAIAERMFDWTVRNIQLDPMPATPKGPEATAGKTETVLPAARGQLGPGYGHLPLEVLLYGHSDAQGRARVFILLCRQVGVDVVMLGFQEEQSVGRRGWLPAAFIGGKFYLFDTALGLSIPGPDGKGIATLDQVKKDPELLQRLEMAGLPYPVSEQDLKQGVLALIDAEPAALSRRMQLLQAAMPTATRLALSTQPSQLEAALRKTQLLSGVSLWQAPFEAVLYRIGLSQRAMQDQQLALELHRLNVLFSPTRPLIKARNLHLQGRFEQEDKRPGARQFYLQCRQPDAAIEKLLSSEGYRKSVGLEQVLPENAAQKQQQLEFITSIARGEKFDATYWIALTYAEVGKAGAAIEWLGKPIVQSSPPSPWMPGAFYNLARCYEQLGQFDLARQWLESDKESPQRHGNLLRSRMIAERQAEQSPGTASASK